LAACDVCIGEVFISYFFLAQFKLEKTWCLIIGFHHNGDGLQWLDSR